LTHARSGNPRSRINPSSPDTSACPAAPLGIDATSCYEKGEIPCTLTQSELDADTPYNTRNKAGLPPTPIASPGRASIEAALNPAEGPWRWYVLSSADGHHTFTDDYDEFLRLKAECAAQGLGCSA